MKQIKFNYNSFKGKTGEFLFQHLFQELGFNVYPLGVETIIPNYNDLSNDIISWKSVSGSFTFFKNIPDFIIYNSEKKIFQLVEVKYRYDGKIQKSKYKNYPYPATLVVVFSLDGVGAFYTNDSEIEFLNLEDIIAFDFNENQKKLIREFSALCNKLLSDVPELKVVESAISEVKEDPAIYKKSQ